jgi:hypothetical protein
MNNIQLKPRVTKIILDKEHNTMIRSSDLVDSQEIEKISEYRLNICNSCSNLFKKGPNLACNFCGCNVEYKSKIIYSLDEDGKAIRNISPEGDYIYVCKLKKW